MSTRSRRELFRRAAISRTRRRDAVSGAPGHGEAAIDRDGPTPNSQQVFSSDSTTNNEHPWPTGKPSACSSSVLRLGRSDLTASGEPTAAEEDMPRAGSDPQRGKGGKHGRADEKAECLLFGEIISVTAITDWVIHSFRFI